MPAPGARRRVSTPDRSSSSERAPVEVPDASLGALDRRIARLLAGAACLFYLLFFHGHFFGSDEMAVYATTRSLYERASLEIPPGPHRYVGRDGRVYGHFAIGQSVLALPFYGLGRMAAAVLPDAASRALAGRPAEGDLIDAHGDPQVFAVALYAVVASGLLVALFYLFERRLGISPRSAVVASLALATTTYVAAMSTYFLRHTSEALTLLGGLYLLLVWRQTRSLRALSLGVLVASSTLLVRVPATVVAPAMAAYLAWLVRVDRRSAAPTPRRQLLLAVGIPLAGVLSVHVALNGALWGTPIASPMLSQSAFFGTPIWIGLHGFLLSPGCSLFVYSPPLLLLPVTLPALWRTQRDECIAVLAISVSLLVFCARFDAWTGLWSSPGPRYLFVLTPFLMLPLGAWLDTRPPRWGWTALGLVALAGLAVQVILMAARWSAVIRIMGYKAYAPEMSFVFDARMSPVIGSARALLIGEHDVWLWGLFGGWQGDASHPFAAGVLLVAILSALGFCARRLVRCLGGANSFRGEPLRSR